MTSCIKPTTAHEADNWSAGSVLKLLLFMEDGSNLVAFTGQCPVCANLIPEHRENCNLDWHIRKLKAETLDQPGQVDERCQVRDR